MIIEIIDKLIDRCLQLVKQHNEQNQQLYSEFVAPALSDLEELHKNYMESFRAYRDLLESSDVMLDSAHPIFEQVKKDSLFSAELRTKAIVLIDFEYDPVVGSFVRAIAMYALGQERYTSYLADGFHGIPNGPRMKTIQGLKEIFQESLPVNEKKQKALATIDELIEERQSDYFWVRQEYSSLKDKLLNFNVNSRE